MKAVLTLVFVCLVSAPAYADPVSDLARSSTPSVVDLGRRMALAEWAVRSEDLLLKAPVAPANGHWKRGDAHFDAALKVMMSRFETWAADVAATSQAKQRVAENFSKALNAGQASSILKKLGTPALKDYSAFSDRNNAMVEFAVGHPDLKIGKPEFTKTFNDYSASLGLARVVDTAEMTAFATSDEGRAYDQARSFGTRSVQAFIDGELQLAFFDHQQDVLEAIRPHAQACAKAHK